MKKQQKFERVESAKKMLKHDSEYLEKIKDSGTVREILTMETRIRIHTLVINSIEGTA